MVYTVCGQKFDSKQQQYILDFAFVIVKVHLQHTLEIRVVLVH